MFHPAYDVPRSAPLPTSVEKHHVSPSVPEISMIFSNTPNTAFKEHAPRFFSQNQLDIHKQVRFQSPPHEKQLITVLPDKNKLLPQNKSKFADVYMANIPNRHLDLSMIDNFAHAKGNTSLPNNDKKTFNFNNSTQEHNHTLDVTNIHTYKCSSSNNNGREIVANTEKAVEKREHSSDEPTVKDLLKIIQQQNEQLLILQQQVSQLIQFQAVQQKPHVTDYYCQRQTNVFSDILAAEKPQEFKQPEVNKGPLSKFAIDVTTSFEVSVRRQQQNKFKQPEPKIQEIKDILPKFNSVKTTGETSKSIENSLVLNEQLPIREDCPSPVNSIHVDMNDYSSESDDDSSSSSSNIDWSLYNNIMEQVNTILRKAQKASNDEGKYKDETMKKVVEATVKHLKSVGINLSSANNADHFQRPPEGTKNYSPTEISFAVKQLLMKYLPPEHLARAVQTKSSSSSASENNEEIVDLIKKRPEFSFATIQYMKKYNLMGTEDRKREKLESSDKMAKQKSNNSPKILDITALKQQPKLL